MKAPELVEAPSPALLASMCVFVHMYIFMGVAGAVPVPLCICLHALGSVCPATDVQVCTGICCEPAGRCAQPLPLHASGFLRNCRPLTLTAPQPGLTSNQDLPHLGIVADNYWDYVFTWLHPVQAQGEVGMGPCWDHKQSSESLACSPRPSPTLPMEGYLTSKCHPPLPWPQPPSLPPQLHTIESPEAPVPLHRGVGTKGKAVGTMPTGQVRVLSESADNHAMVLAGCAEVSGGHRSQRGQSRGWGRRGLQEVDHEGRRGAQCWLICRGGSDELARALGGGCRVPGLVPSSTPTSRLPAAHPSPPAESLQHPLSAPPPPTPASISRPVSPHNALHPLHYPKQLSGLSVPF